MTLALTIWNVQLGNSRIQEAISLLINRSDPDQNRWFIDGFRFRSATSLIRVIYMQSITVHFTGDQNARRQQHR